MVQYRGLLENDILKRITILADFLWAVAALILKGLSPSAALVFLMTGPATNAAGLATIWNTLGRRVAILYLLTVAGCALVAGITLDLLVGRIDIAAMSHAHAMIPPLVQNVLAVVLLAVLGYAFLAPKRR